MSFTRAFLTYPLNTGKKVERLTTNRNLYFKEIIKELTAIDLLKSETNRFTFCEVGQLLTHGYSISLIFGEKDYFKIKIWNSNYDNYRFKLGIFNLDRLAVTESNLDISELDLKEVNRILKLEIDTIEYSGIVLDGLFCQLRIRNKILEWNIDKEMNKGLNSLISILRKRVNEQQNV